MNLLNKKRKQPKIQRQSENKGTVVFFLTFDLDKDGVANAPQVIVGHADVLPSVLLRHVQDLQGLVVVLKLDFACWQVAALLEPLDGGCGPAGGTRADSGLTSLMQHNSTTWG